MVTGIYVTDVTKLSTDDYKKECVVQVVDDQRFEATENFRLVLGSAYSQRFGQAKIGANNITVIHIEDDGDGEFGRGGLDTNWVIKMDQSGRF